MINELPFLFGFATKRTDASSVDGFYCKERSMWIDSSLGLPAIEVSNHPELRTITKVKQEQDDECASSLEILTKTHANVEKDDSDPYFSTYSQLHTKTDACTEADDTALNYSLF